MNLPLFKSHYSIGKSILTLEKASEIKDDYPVSIVDIAVKHGLKQVVLVEENFSGFLEAYQNLKAKNIQLIFGIRFTFTDNLSVKTDDSLSSEHRVILMAKNQRGYHELIKIYSKAATDGFYYVPRMDFDTLKEFDMSNIDIWIPFYDSYLYYNTLYDKQIVPNVRMLQNAKYIKEDNGLPFDGLLQNRLSQIQNPIISAKTIYYYKKEDFKTYLTFRCINKRTQLNVPELEHMTSNQFSFNSL